MNAIPPHRQPVAPTADVARGILPSQVIRDERAGGGFAAPAGSPSDIARALRLYGGPTLETQRDDANDTVLLSAALAMISGCFTMWLGGEGVPLVLPIGGGLCFAALLMFAEAVTRRNRVERRIDDVDAKVTAALSDVLAVGA